MEDIKNPKSPDDCSNPISKDTQQSVDDSLNQSRSYLCSFCIRGFSNAQALGGHMNIHRRDRAKLRQKLIEDDVVVECTDSSEVISLDLNELQDHEEVLTCDDDDHDVQYHQDQMDKDISPAGPNLGFWVEENKQSRDHGKIKEVNIDGSSSSHYNEIEGLDLELRLGQSAEKKKTT